MQSAISLSCPDACLSWRPILWVRAVGGLETPRDCAHPGHCPLCPGLERLRGAQLMHLPNTLFQKWQRGRRMVLNEPKCVFADLWKCQPPCNGRQLVWSYEWPSLPSPVPLWVRAGLWRGRLWSNVSELALFMSIACSNSDNCSGSLEVAFDLTFCFPLFSFASSYF